MRHLVVILMLVLLPLRGWIGDAMAMDMAAAALAQPAHAIETNAHHAHGSMPAADLAEDHAMPADCATHATGNSQAASNCDTCTACQNCHAVALTPSFPHLAPAPPPVDRRLAAAHHFASAERAPGFKPPIS